MPYNRKNRREFVITKTFLPPEATHLVLLGISAGVRWLSARGRDYHLHFAGRQTHILSASLANCGTHSSALMRRLDDADGFLSVC